MGRVYSLYKVSVMVRRAFQEVDHDQVPGHLENHQQSVSPLNNSAVLLMSYDCLVEEYQTQLKHSLRAILHYAIVLIFDIRFVHKN